MPSEETLQHPCELGVSVEKNAEMWYKTFTRVL